MSWLSNVWNSITGNSGNQLAQQQQQNNAFQQQLFAQQQAESDRQRAEMAADEEKRQTAIRGGTSAIDQAFAQFNDPSFYKGAEDKYLGYYLPQIDEQAGQTRDKLVAKLFDRGMLESSVGANTLADLEKKRVDERTRVGNEAADFSSGIRNKVNTQKNALYDVARSAADPNAIASRATGEAATLAQAPGGFTQNANSGLGDVFSSMLEPFAYGLQGYQNRTPQGYRPSTPSGGSSQRIF